MFLAFNYQWHIVYIYMGCDWVQKKYVQKICSKKDSTSGGGTNIVCMAMYHLGI